MEIFRCGDGGYIIRRGGLDVPVGLTGVFDTWMDAQQAIRWYYSQDAVA